MRRARLGPSARLGWPDGRATPRTVCPLRLERGLAARTCGRRRDRGRNRWRRRRRRLLRLCRRLLELLQRLPQAASQLGQLLRSEEDQPEREGDHQILTTNHLDLSAEGLVADVTPRRDLVWNSPR